MTTRLTPAEFAIKVGDYRAVVRPTLRAAFVLEQRYSFPALFRAVEEQNLTILCDVIRQGDGDSNAVASLIGQIGGVPLGVRLDAITVPIFAFLLSLAGIDNDETSEKPSGDPIPYREYHTRLFRIGTGWLGWTPEATWNATPAEIIEAHKGRLEMLKAIFGGSDDATSNLSLDDKMALTMNTLAARHAPKSIHS